MVKTVAYSSKSKDEYIHVLYIDRLGYYRSFGVAGSNIQFLQFMNELKEIPFEMLQSLIGVKHQDFVDAVLKRSDSFQYHEL